MRTLAPLGRPAGTIFLSVLLACAVAIAVQGVFQARISVAETFARQSNVQTAQLSLEELLRSQIVEENALRGYALTRDPYYVEQYFTATSAFDARISSIRVSLASEQIRRVEQLLAEYVRVQNQWRDEVAAPVLRQPAEHGRELDRRNKVFSDYESRIVALMRADLQAAEQSLARSTQTQLERDAYVRTFWFLIFGLLAILLNAFRTRLYGELAAERITTEKLQSAFRSESEPLPNCDVGTAYRSASSHLAVGGDVFDVHRLDESQALLLIADVSGKGIDAAVLTAFIKFTIRGIALRHFDPGAILAEFNLAFSQAVKNPSLFVSMLAGVLDTRTFAFHYASAGLDSAFVRRADRVERLEVTGPVLGIMDEPFGTSTTDLHDGDAIVLATDGLTEARNRSGAILGDDGAMRLIERGPRDAQQLADALAAAVRSIAGGRLQDDLAILVVRVNPRRPDPSA